ncbi:hypothetical protein V6N13_022109 [Hibiscus sabdariffa]
MSFSPTISSFCINVSEKCKPSHLVRAAKDEARNGVFSSSSSSCDVYSSNSTNSFQKLTIVESLKVATSFAHPPSHPHQTTVLRLLQKVISMETSTTHRYRWPLSSSHHGHCSHPVDLLLISTIFIGPDVVSLLALIGLECIFHLGATLFLLMVDYCAQSMNPPRQASKSKPPPSSQLCNLVATLTGFVFPLVDRFGWRPRLCTRPTVCCKLQLVRGLRLGAELNAPAWMMHCIRGLVCWWVLILGVQLMRVAWFVGVTAGARQHQSSTDD